MPLLDPQGRALAKTEQTGSAVISAFEKPGLPARWAGFAIRVVVGPYPFGSNSHRRAVYCELTPIEDPAHSICKRLGAEMVRSCIPLTVDAAKLVDADPNCDVGEKTGLDAIHTAQLEVRREVAGTSLDPRRHGG